MVCFRCISKCYCCYKLKECPLGNWKYCKDCYRWFVSDQCFENHIAVTQPRGENKKQRVNQSICQKYKRCEHCDKKINFRSARKTVNKEGKIVAIHHCGYVWCKSCKYEHPDGHHECFMQTIDMRDKKKKQQKPRLSKDDKALLSVLEDLYAESHGESDQECAEEEEDVRYSYLEFFKKMIYFLFAGIGRNR